RATARADSSSEIPRRAARASMCGYRSFGIGRRAGTGVSAMGSKPESRVERGAGRAPGAPGRGGRRPSRTAGAPGGTAGAAGAPVPLVEDVATDVVETARAAAVGVRFSARGTAMIFGPRRPSGPTMGMNVGRRARRRAGDSEDGPERIQGTFRSLLTGC